MYHLLTHTIETEFNMLEFIRRSSYLFAVAIFACTCLYHLHSFSVENNSLAEKHTLLQYKHSILVKDIKTHVTRYEELQSRKEETDTNYKELRKSHKYLEDDFKQSKSILTEKQRKLFDAISIVVNISQATGLQHGKNYIETYMRIKSDLPSFLDKIRELQGVEEELKKEHAKYSLLRKNHKDLKSERDVLAQELKEAEDASRKLRNEIEVVKREEERRKLVANSKASIAPSTTNSQAMNKPNGESHIASKTKIPVNEPK